MKKNKFNLRPNTLLNRLELLIVLILSSLYIVTGCSSVETTSPIEEIIVQDAKKVDDPLHNIDANPTPLAGSDEDLSLEGYGAVGALNDTNLTVSDMLMYAVQDEYLAHGEYQAIIEAFGDQKPYTNIMNAEITHLSLLEEVYASYEVDFPSDDSGDHLIVPADLLEAAKTGVQAEIDNIAMYELFMTYDLPDNVAEVFTILKKGSESHLLAFKKQVDRLE